MLQGGLVRVDTLRISQILRGKRYKDFILFAFYFAHLFVLADGITSQILFMQLEGKYVLL